MGIDSKTKQENYRTQFIRLKKALDNNFYLEAIFIEYAIIEDRAEAILSYEGNTIVPKNDREFINFARKKTRICKLAERKGSVIGRYFSESFMNDLMDWVNRRNSVIHALLKQRTTREELKAFAEEGELLCKTFRNNANNYKRMVERRSRLSEDI